MKDYIVFERCRVFNRWHCHIEHIILSIKLNTLRTYFIQKRHTHRSFYSILIVTFLTLFTFSCSVQSYSETKLISFVGSALPGMPYQTQSFIVDESGYIQSALYSSDGYLIELKSGYSISNIDQLQFPQSTSSKLSSETTNHEIVVDFLPSLMVLGHTRNHQLVDYRSQPSSPLDFQTWLYKQDNFLNALSQQTNMHRYYLQVLPLSNHKPNDLFVREDDVELTVAIQNLFKFLPLDKKSPLLSLLTINRENIYHPIIVAFKSEQFVFNIYRINN